MRGLLPAASLSHMGMFASGQAYESLLLHLFASPLPEAHRYGEMLLGELQKIIPSFVQRDRAARARRALDRVPEVLEGQQLTSGRTSSASASRSPTPRPGRTCACCSHEGDERRLATALLFEAGTAAESRHRRRRRKPRPARSSRRCSATSSATARTAATARAAATSL